MNRTGTTRRLIGGTAANLFDKVAILLVQVGLAPLISQHWGAQGYGSWLMLMTIPTYLALSDLGIGTTAAVAAAKAMARKDLATSQAVLQTALVLVAGISALIMLTILGWYGLSNRTDTASGDPPAVIVIVAYGLMMVIGSIPAAALQADHKYALSQWLTGLTFLLEGGALAATIASGCDAFVAASALLATRTLSVLGFMVLARRGGSGFAFGTRYVRWSLLQNLIQPSLGTMALTLSGALLLQGTVLTLGWSAGAAVVAGFAVARLLSRIPLQLSALVSRASQMELTRAHAVADVRMVSDLTRLNILTSLAFAPLSVVGLCLFGPMLVALLTAGTAQITWPTMLFLGLSASLNALWNGAATVLIAQNQQHRFAYWALAAAALAAATPLWLPWGATGAAAAMVLADACMVLLVLAQIAGTRQQAIVPIAA